MLAVVIAYSLAGFGCGAEAPDQAGSNASSPQASQDPDGTLDSSGSTAEAAQSARRNIIFLLTDDLSWNLVRYMPNVMKMQQTGATFTNYFVSNSLCCPSRASMFTGKYPHNSGVLTNVGADDGGYEAYKKLGNDRQSFAVALAASGYRTVMMGKFLNGYEPTVASADPGWTDWYVAGNGYPGFNYDLNANGKIVHYGRADADYLPDVMSRIAEAKIKFTRTKPFLIEISTFTPHLPATPAPRHAALFPNLAYPRTPAFATRPTATDPAWLRAVPALSQTQITRLAASFRRRVRSVQAIDEMIGALQAALKASGHGSDTYIFFASDNGYHMGERSLREGKATAFDTDIRVPLIVTGPGVPAGLVVDEIAQNVDLCATFADIAQTPAPATSIGHSLLRLARGEQVANWRNVALIEHRNPKLDASDPDANTAGVTYNPPTYNALRTADSLYVEYATGEVEYHDRTADPHELHNTASQLPARKRAQLHTALGALKACKTAAECWTAAHLAP